MARAQIIVDRDFVLADLDRRVFGTFVEHLGRCVYGGIYEPGHPTADENGFRGDVMELTKELGATIVRYPGGNFMSGYNWEDAVGPAENRPKKLDLAWFSTETNQFGTNEFMDWCRKTEIEPMLGVNLGTRGADEAREFLEYCNHPGGSHFAEMRKSHGYDEPHDVKFWCLGNEMDGPWQICQKTAEEYGRVALETAKVMRWLDPTLTLSACGSSHRQMPTYGSWEYEVLDHCYEQVDFISLHTYFANKADDIEDYFGVIDQMDSFIKEVVAICDAVGAKKRASKRIMLSFDEWNVWYKAHTIEHMRKPGWPEAPALLEEIYNVEDALVVGGALITLINNADRVKTACIAQLVNVIGPIMTETGGPAWRQTIFHPFALSSRYGHGRVMRTEVRTPNFSTKTVPEAPLLVAAVVDDPTTGRNTVFALNRSVSESLDLEVELRGLGTGRRLVEACELHNANLKATNTKAAPNNVVPQQNRDVSVEGERLRVKLKPLSWNVIVTEAEPVSLVPGADARLETGTAPEPRPQAT
ncbi:alpha-N-arabinofuranosidase [Faunimonas pinastri]|uniref:non-reducing end alpha-L-arabinofuranosidase n=1 Tax=Faunimonas pinastri TaxID=1855383 RepID=A0A1H9K0V4_9HYPH|nr:alpha-N-arabinofuranosidase [Faunimonas pinastri]SEQ92710.1 alpha-N-arabinofuranosidase [Faunimonas pinastri]